ncbi:MAG: hypothetical protein DRP10_02905 [Candidatus Aenigmatarchaeota archaeon]|nr:MAG: hypothetical protein DRP10_02905 [Candidatus Aenigmarchaeota archaeon]
MVRNPEIESLIEGETKETAEQSFKSSPKKRFDILKIIEKCPGQRKDIAEKYVMFLGELNAKFKLDKTEEEIEKVGSVDNVRHILDDLIKWGKIKKKETKRYPIYYLSNIQEVIIKFRKKYGREPTKEEIAYEIGKSPRDKKSEEELYKIAKKIGWKKVSKKDLINHSKSIIKDEYGRIYDIDEIIDALDDGLVTDLSAPCGHSIKLSKEPELRLKLFCEHIKTGYPEVMKELEKYKKGKPNKLEEKIREIIFSVENGGYLKGKCKLCP